VIWLDPCGRDLGKALLGVELWAEIRRLKYVEGVSQREIHRRTSVHRDTIRNALASSTPPVYGPRPRRPSKLEPFVATIEELIAEEPTLSGVRIREELEKLGYVGGKTILDDLLRELRPRFLPPPRSFQRTRYRPGELAQFDLCEPRSEIPVGWGQTRRGYVVTCELPYSRAFAGTLVFSKEFSDIAFGMSRCLQRLRALPAKLVWDREGAIAPRGRPTEQFLAFCGQVALGWVILDAGDCQAKGALERSHRFLHGNFEAGRIFANALDFQDRPIYASTATTTRWTRAWSAAASRCAFRRPRSWRSRSTLASSPAATRACSPAASRSPTPPTRPRWTSCAASADARAATSTSSCGRSRAMTS
jgi:transposase